MGGGIPYGGGGTNGTAACLLLQQTWQPLIEGGKRGNHRDWGESSRSGRGGSWKMKGLGDIATVGFLGGGEGGFERGSLVVEGLYSGCMGWIHAPPPPLAATQISYEIPSF
jgi:hypothetical protein